MNLIKLLFGDNVEVSRPYHTHDVIPPVSPSARAEKIARDGAAYTQAREDARQRRNGYVTVLGLLFPLAFVVGYFVMTYPNEPAHPYVVPVTGCVLAGIILLLGPRR